MAAKIAAARDAANEPPKPTISERAGGAPAFLSFLVDTLRPELAREYRMSSDHTLFGHSSGGTFCTYALLSRPEGFSKYICGSPDLYAQDSELFRQEARYAAMHKDLAATVYFGAGEGEMTQHLVAAFGVVSSMTRMVEILSERRYPSLKLHCQIVAGEEHTPMIQHNLDQGLLSVWRSDAATARLPSFQ